MPYLRCTSCGCDRIYSPRRLVVRGCPDCGADVAFDRHLELHDRPDDGLIADAVLLPGALGVANRENEIPAPAGRFSRRR